MELTNEDIETGDFFHPKWGKPRWNTKVASNVGRRFNMASIGEINVTMGGLREAQTAARCASTALRKCMEAMDELADGLKEVADDYDSRHPKGDEE